jgi:hypothetical protein
MPVQVYSRLQDNDGTDIEVDSVITYALVTIPVQHHEIHEGEMFETSYKSPEGSNIADNATLVLHFLTGAKENHFTFTVAAGGDCEVSLYEAPSLTANGPRLDVHNLHRDSDDVSVTSVWQGSTFTGGVQLTNFLLVGGTGGNASGGISRQGLERILRPNTIYMVEATNRAGTAQPMSILADWYEED